VIEEMTQHPINRTRALEVLLPMAMIVTGSVAGMGWLGLAGTILLGFVVARALLRQRDDDGLPRFRGFWFAAASVAILGAVMVALVFVELPAYALIAGFAAALVAGFVALGYIVWWMVRLNNA
jgi:hypothetical protein